LNMMEPSSALIVALNGGALPGNPEKTEICTPKKKAKQTSRDNKMEQYTRQEIIDINTHLNGENTYLINLCSIYTHIAKRFKCGIRRDRTWVAFNGERNNQLRDENALAAYQMRQNERDGGSAHNPRQHVDMKV